MENLDSQQLNLLITLRLRQLHNNGLKGILFDDLVRMYRDFIWKNGQPVHLNEIASDVFRVSDETIVRWLATESKIDGYRYSLEDFLPMLEDEEL
ncbi:DNA-binding protein [Erysipelothrix inopinata]|uniref:DNA-binding protein n=1 Tax=Erysipelothrix inopinata TaxID=225084 RepID=A0A7G9RYA8_9FIRM|nr:post-transcriptional regulator [Erysipelothrix inopinata]QNN60583.1 DNA-binding protein [Erysipelothrix inopinata]